MSDRTRRWVLRAGGTAGLVASAGCLRLSDAGGRQDVSGATSQPTTNPPSGDGSTTEPGTSAGGVTADSDWEPTTKGDASVDVTSPSRLEFRVFRCAKAAATRRFEAEGSDVTIAFAYEVEAEEWFEAPYLIVRDGGEPAYESRNKGVDDKTFRVERGATAGGTFERTVPVDGSFAIEMGIRPSDYCSNGDHGNTYFRVRDLAVS